MYENGGGVKKSLELGTSARTPTHLSIVSALLAGCLRSDPLLRGAPPGHALLPAASPPLLGVPSPFPPATTA